MAVPPDNLEAARVRRRAILRVVLGNAQMFFAVAAAVVLVLTGVNAYSVGAAVVASAFTVTSLWLFRRR